MLSVPMWQPTVVQKESSWLGEVGDYLDGHLSDCFELNTL